MTKANAKYAAIAEALRERIRQHEATTLPSERELAREFGTTQMTVRRALTELEEDGLILRRPRRVTQIVQRAAPIRIYSGHCEAVREVMMGHLRERFPGESFDFLQTESAEAVIGRCDIMMTPTSLPHDYERWFMPLPDELVERLRGNPGISAQTLEIHRNAGRYYGVPVLASAGGMQVNLALLGELGEESGGAFDIPRMFQMARKLAEREDGAALLDPAFYNTMIMHLILMYDHGEEGLTEAVRQALEVLAELIAGGMRDFGTGKALFRIVCRQTVVYHEAREKLVFPVKVVPLPAGSPWSGIPFSESLLVGRDHPSPGRLFEICESLVEPSAQEAIGRTRHGYPVLASARYTSLQHPVAGDEVFAFGLERCCFRQPPLLRQLRPVLWVLLSDVLAGSATMAEAREGILDALRGLQLRHMANRRFVDQFGVRGGGFAHAVA